MPITSYHLGPAFLVKQIVPKRFSFRVFLLTQLIIDFEVLYFLIVTYRPQHKFLHTFVGATLVAIFCVWPGRYILMFCTKIWNMMFSRIDNFKLNADIPLDSAIIASAFGSYTQVILDALMHPEIELFYPVDHNNYILDWVSVNQLHAFCAIAGLIGIIIHFNRKVRKENACN